MNAEIIVRRIKYCTWFFTIIVFFVSLYFLYNSNDNTKPIAGEGQPHEAKYNTTIGKGNFSLLQVAPASDIKDNVKRIFTQDNLKGEYSLIYFGFTYCPDICPTSLDKLLNVKKVLDKYNIKVNFIFVTIDPQRDNPELMQDYLKHFDKEFIGLTGNEEQIKNISDIFKVFYVRADNTESDSSKSHMKKEDQAAPSRSDYMIDHTSFIYFMNKEGEYIKHFYFDNKAEDIIEFIRVYNNNSEIAS
ncbi:MAG TPA: SCO family protein [Candidatus Megaira endosymbiont of Hartmannula sinica]|nr:SCO family protein [Candidatus Megaera endosymbiont of Hartmannula sinica]